MVLANLRLGVELDTTITIYSLEIDRQDRQIGKVRQKPFLNGFRYNLKASQGTRSIMFVGFRPCAQQHIPCRQPPACELSRET